MKINYYSKITIIGKFEVSSVLLGHSPATAGVLWMSWALLSNQPPLWTVFVLEPPIGFAKSVATPHQDPCLSCFLSLFLSQVLGLHCGLRLFLSNLVLPPPLCLMGITPQYSSCTPLSVSVSASQRSPVAHASYESE